MSMMARLVDAALKYVLIVMEMALCEVTKVGLEKCLEPEEIKNADKREKCYWCF